MRSIYHQVLGEQFHQLHPNMQKKYGLTSEQNMMALGQGRMTEIRGTPALMRPFLQIGVKDHLVFAERGKDIPFTIENYAYVDERGHETVSWVRRFFFPYAVRGLDGAMHYNEEKQMIADRLGKSGLLSTNLDLQVTPEGGLYMQSVDMSLRGEYQIPGPHTSVYEHYDKDQDAYRIHVHVEHPLVGTMLMYEGLVHTEFLPVTLNNIPNRGILE